MTRPASLRQRITVVVMTTTFAALLLSASALLIYELRSFRSAWTADLTTQAELVAQSTAAALTFDDARAARENLALLRLRPQIQAAAVYGASGKRVATYSASSDTAPNVPDTPGELGSSFQGDRLQLLRAIEHGGARVGTVYLVAQYDVSGRLTDYLAILVGVTLASLGLAAVIFGSLERALTQPILALAQAARDVAGRRDYRLKVRKTTDDEVGVLVDAFNDMLRDLSAEMEQRQKAEDALRMADRRKDEFLATLAHELRNPLAPLVTSLALLKNEAAAPATRVRARELMSRQLRQMVRLIDDLLDVSRITTNKLELQRERVDLVAIVDDAIEVTEPLMRERRHALVTEGLDRGALWIEGDPTRLTQVIVNLLNNAAKYTDPGGRIVVGVGHEDDRAVVRVEDDGLGIEPSQQADIFEMFMQLDRTLERERAGLGVGLSLAKRLVELHQGRITVQSAGVGEGSVFTVSLPLAPAEEAAERALLPAASRQAMEGAGDRGTLRGPTSAQRAAQEGDARTGGDARAADDATTTGARSASSGNGDAPPEGITSGSSAGSTVPASHASRVDHTQTRRSAATVGGAETTSRAAPAGTGETTHGDEARAETESGGDGQAAGRRLAILIADDNVDLATSLRDMLELLGHHVRIVHDGEAALAAAVDELPDVALFDIGMPQINGYELARRIRADARTRDLMMVAITGWGQDADRRRAREAGFDRHLVKPVEPSALFALLASCERRPAREGTGA